MIDAECLFLSNFTGWVKDWTWGPFWDFVLPMKNDISEILDLTSNSKIISEINPLTSVPLMEMIYSLIKPFGSAGTA